MRLFLGLLGNISLIELAAVNIFGLGKFLDSFQSPCRGRQRETASESGPLPPSSLGVCSDFPCENSQEPGHHLTLHHVKHIYEWVIDMHLMHCAHLLKHPASSKLPKLASNSETKLSANYQHTRSRVQQYSLNVQHSIMVKWLTRVDW